MNATTATMRRRAAGLFQSLGMAALLLVAAGARADTTPPDVVVRTTSEEVLKLVAEDPELRKGNPAKVIELIETRVVPHFDTARMTRLAVGQPWRTATKEQQAALIQEFKTLLVRSYGAAYTTYRQVKMEVPPLKLAGNEDDVTVKSNILLPGGAPPVRVDYAMASTPDGWKVYNVVVDGVSLVTNYRNDFAGQIQQGGIEGLLGNLRERNAKAAQTVKK